MKLTVNLPTEVNIKYLRMTLPVEEDIPNNFPLRDGNKWEATVDVDTGKILNWPEGKQPVELNLKVDGGTYELLDEQSKRVGKLLKEDYVPKLVPGQYGDYVELDIASDGTITNWRAPKDAYDVIPFFPDPDDD